MGPHLQQTVHSAVISPQHSRTETNRLSRTSSSRYDQAMHARQMTEAMKAETVQARRHLGQAKRALRDRQFPDPLL